MTNKMTNKQLIEVIKSQQEHNKWLQFKNLKLEMLLATFKDMLINTNNHTDLEFVEYHEKDMEQLTMKQITEGNI